MERERYEYNREKVIYCLIRSFDLQIRSIITWAGFFLYLSHSPQLIVCYCIVCGGYGAWQSIHTSIYPLQVSVVVICQYKCYIFFTKSETKSNLFI